MNTKPSHTTHGERVYSLGMNDKQQDDHSLAFFLGGFLGIFVAGVIVSFVFFGILGRSHEQIYSLKCEKFGGKIISKYNVCIKDNQELVIK